mgnify:FL=1
MHRHDQRPTGPDFLASFAEQNLASGLLDNANEFRVRAKEWREDKATIQSLRDQLQNSEDRNVAAKLALAGK